jgi:hypothetical protein
MHTISLFLISLLLFGSVSRAQDVRKQTDENMYHAATDASPILRKIPSR